ncbi:MAG TPA: DUF6588 family protein [Chryseolinea sp.]
MMLFVRKSFLLLLFIAFTVSSFAQSETDIGDYLKAGPEDAGKLMSAYLSPMITAASYGFNGGWFTTAKAHKTLGFDLGVSVNGVFIPSSNNYFRPAELGLKTTTLVSPTSGNAPTLVGPGDATTYASTYGGQSVTFSGPKGLDFKDNFKISGALAPTVQLGIGIVKNTDLKIRWMPEVKAGDTKVKYFGFGVLHDIKQHIAGIKHLPFDLSVMVGYTNLKGTTNIAGFVASGDATKPQELHYNMNAWLMQALISKKLAMVTFYGGLGYNAVKTSADVKGSYAFLPVTPVTPAINDPVAMSFKNNSFRVTAGMRLNLGPIYLSGDYTLQKFSTVSVGLGVTVR